MRILKLYYNTSWYFRTDELPLTKQQLKLEKLLNDPTNYYKDFCFTLTYNQIKDIFENDEYKLSVNDLINYIDTKDYLYFLNHSNINLSLGITDPKNKYKNILVDLKNQKIPDWALLDISIEDLFKINKLSTKLDSYESYESYFGNEDTYSTFKKWLKFYIDNVLLYFYKDEVLTFSEFANKYNKENYYYKNLHINTKNHKGSWINRIVELDPEVQELEYKCLSVKDHQDLSKDSLSNLKIKLNLVNIHKNKKIINPNFLTELYNYDIIEKELLNLWF